MFSVVTATIEERMSCFVFPHKGQMEPRLARLFLHLVGRECELYTAFRTSFDIDQQAIEALMQTFLCI
jgi:hypothetical protein